MTVGPEARFRRTGNIGRSALVHVIDDDPQLRRFVVAVIESTSLTVNVHESAEEFLDEVNLEKPGCILLDLRMPGMGGIELLGRLKAKRNDMSVIIMSGHADVPAAVHGMQLGATDLLQKPLEPHGLISAVRVAIEKSLAIHQSQLENEAIRQRVRSLTARELELLKLAVAGKSNKEIAFALKISIKTVDNHRANLKVKMAAGSTADLVRMSLIARI